LKQVRRRVQGKSLINVAIFSHSKAVDPAVPSKDALTVNTGRTNRRHGDEI